VTAANELYRLTLQLVTQLHEMGKYFVVENPARSHFWAFMSAARSMKDVSSTIFQQCMYGGNRRKSTQLLTNFSPILELNRSCDESHQHLPWSCEQQNGELVSFDTSSEAVYPRLLCKAVTELVAAELPTDIDVDAFAVPNCPRPQHSAAMKAMVGKLPRGRNLAALMPEYGATTICRVVAASDWPQVKLPDGRMGRALRVIGDIGVNLKRGSAVEEKFVGRSLLCVVGIFATKQEFLEKAISDVIHPMAHHVCCRTLLQDILRDTFASAPHDTVQFRIDNLKWLSDKKKELAGAEAELHLTMDPEVRRVVGNKQLLLLDAFVERFLGFSPNYATKFAEGFELTGWVPESHLFASEVRPMSESAENLLDRSVWTERAARPSAAEGPIADAVRDSCSEEVARGWMSGPYTMDQLDAHFGKGRWISSPRFAIHQSDKYRPIDDYSSSSINSTAGLLEKLDLMGTEEVAALIRSVFRIRADDSGYVQHPAWRSIRASDLVIGSLDLSKAYRQLPIAARGRRFSIIRIPSRSGKGFDYFIQNALPFGALASVGHFNGWSRCVWAVTAVAGRLIIGNYYDDYPVVSPTCISGSASAFFRGALEILGIDFDVEGKKALRLGDEATIYGVVINTASLSSTMPSITVSNKESRRDELRATITAMISAGRATVSALASLKGRLGFAEGQIFGRRAAYALRALTTDPCMQGGDTVWSMPLLHALQILLDRVVDSPPRIIRCQPSRAPILLFTDGACAEVTSHGACLIDVENGLRLCWGAVVEECVCLAWSSDPMAQLVGQAEISPVVASIYLWRSLLRHRQVVVFVDNNSAKDALVSGASPVLASDLLLRSCAIAEDDAEASFWYTRVTSESNVADWASRLQFEPLVELGFTRVPLGSCVDIAGGRRPAWGGCS